MKVMEYLILIIIRAKVIIPDYIHLQVEDDGDNVKLVGHFLDRLHAFKRSYISINRDQYHYGS